MNIIKNDHQLSIVLDGLYDRNDKLNI